jgi:transcriptional regulator with XRE-family HTH domain
VSVVDITPRDEDDARMADLEFYEEVGGLIAARRARLGLNQTALAALAGMSRSALANIELGRQRVLVHQLFALAKALNTASPDELLPTLKEADDVAVSGSNLTAQQRAQVMRFVDTHTSAAVRNGRP